MLLFEFFPLCVAMVGALAAIGLFLKDRRSRADPTDHEEPPVGPNAGAVDEKPGRRPSMLP